MDEVRSILQDGPIILEKKDRESSSLDDASRKELMWEAREEKLIQGWIEKCFEKSRNHISRCHSFKIRYHFWGGLSVFTPILFGGLIRLSNFKFQLETIGFILSGLTSAINVFFDFNGLRSKHLEYACKYEDFAHTMQAELVKPKRNRAACDMFLARCELQLGSLNRSSPDI